ncbi:heparan-alpha-glucosaminide N-acetyltransferase domain-containing protein [Auritidibacter ignavus]|uniref:heparan-alpha-glucosaminide N-acetyltransferase domain-containing protein n=1 Tax=Auritidibacter ignavus TaxID=678932 RepID=UPI000F04496C|nr:heparan-alpha-glucosaminide N-acetyltransferase domain-containing protein [Auritidibacter ignavus]NIH72295.1 putative membrane protein [Auritidibacter ignavus]RMX23701.1 DUF1624 domain-containing protein [Auritidibacter ignavus]
MASSSSTTGSPFGLRQRLTGIDVARALAILGMIAVHVYPLNVTDAATGRIVPSWVGWIAAGSSSVLFCVVAGVSVVLLSRNASTVGFGQIVIRLLLRATVLVLLGLTLGQLDSGVAVILVHYGVLFVIAIAFLKLSAKVLGVLAVSWLVLMPLLFGVLNRFLQAAMGRVEYVNNFRLWSNPNFITLLEQPGVTLWDVLVSGYYPVLVWTGFLLLGMFIAKMDLRSFPVHLLLFGAGLLVAGLTRAAGYGLASNPERLRRWSELSFTDPAEAPAAALTGSGMVTQYLVGDPSWYVMVAPHSTAPLDVISTAGIAVAVIGLCLILTQHTAGLGDKVLYPLIGAGAIPLTLYVAHVLVMAVLGDEAGSEWTVLLIQWGACLILGTALRIVGWRGPLEFLIHAVSTHLIVLNPPAKDSR